MTFGYAERRQRERHEKATAAIRFLRVTLALVVVSATLLGVGMYQAHTFDKNYHADVRLAQQAGGPAAMQTHLVDARAGLDRIGYDTGQYAWVLQTPSTDTDRKRALLASHIDRISAIRSMDDSAEREVAFLEYRDRFTSDAAVSAPDIDTYSWWWHSLPYGIGLLFNRLVLLVLFATASITAVGFYLSGEHRALRRADTVSYRHALTGVPDAEVTADGD